MNKIRDFSIIAGPQEGLLDVYIRRSDFQRRYYPITTSSARRIQDIAERGRVRVEIEIYERRGTPPEHLETEQWLWVHLK